MPGGQKSALLNTKKPTELGDGGGEIGGEGSVDVGLKGVQVNLNNLQKKISSVVTSSQLI